MFVDVAQLTATSELSWERRWISEHDVSRSRYVDLGRATCDTDVETFAAQGRDDSLGVWREWMLSKGMPKHVSDVLVSSLQRIEKSQTNVSGKTFSESMKIEGFNRLRRSPEKFQAFWASPPSVALGLVSLLLWLGPAIHSFWHRLATA